MNDHPAPPLRPDMRLVIEAVLDGLTYAFAGIVALDLGTQSAVLATLTLGSIVIMLRRLLGKSYTGEIAQSDNQVKSVIAQNSVLQADVSPKVLATAVEAGTAVRTNTVTPPPPAVIP